MRDAAFISLKPDWRNEKEFLYLPAEFLEDMRPFSGTPQSQHEIAEASGEATHLYSGSIILTNTSIVLALAVTPCGCGNYREEKDSNNKLTMDGTGTVEFVVFTDIIDTVTGFQRWVTGAPPRTVCYLLELLGGAHYVIFSPKTSGGALFSCARDGGGISAVAEPQDNLASGWVCHFENFIGQSIETCIWVDSSGNEKNGDVNDVRASTFFWKQLEADATRELGCRSCHARCEGERDDVCNWCSPAKDRNVVCPVAGHETSAPFVRMASSTCTEFMLQGQRYLDEAIAIHISLIHEEHDEREDLLLRSASLLAQMVTPRAAAKPVGLSIASTSLSLQSHAAAAAGDAKEGTPSVTDEVMQLLAEEEEVARMKFARYTATAQPSNSAF